MIDADHGRDSIVIGVDERLLDKDKEAVKFA